MKTVLLRHHGGPEVLEIQDVADPQPRANEVLVSVKASTVNHLDLFQRDGSRPIPSLPFTPGLEAAGIVLQDSNGFKAGEHVLTSRASGANGGGGYADTLAVSAQDLARIPEGVSFADAAAAGLAASTAWAALFDLGHLEKGERVLIWAGSSGVGSAAIQLAKQAGAWVATTTGDDRRAEALRLLGADLVLNRKSQNIGQELQKQGGVNLVIELVSTTLQESLNASARYGRIILIGNLGGQEATVDTQSWRMKLVQIIGGGQARTSIANEERYLRLIEEKKFNPLIARTFPIEQAADAHRLLESGEPQGKIVLLHS